MQNRLLAYDFKTHSGNQYVFDGCTGMVYPITDLDLLIIRCYKNKILGDIIIDLKSYYKQEDIFKSYNKIKKLIEIDDAFYPIWEKGSRYNFMSEEEFSLAITNVANLILELTEQCNLRCKYCIYGDSNKIFRKHSNFSMTWEIAKKSIDHYVHLINSPSRTFPLERAALGFYGGESLLQFKLMKRCVDYCNSISINNKIDFIITTNATLLTEEIIRFFIKNNFALTVSLDGPASEHDKNRISINGDKTFQKIWNSLKLISSISKEYYKQNVNFNAVYTPIHDLDKIADFFSKRSPYLYNQAVNLQSVDTRGFNYEKIYGCEVWKKFECKLEHLTNIYYDYINLKPVDKLKIRFLKLMFEKPNIQFKKRLNRNPKQATFRAASCIPGARRIFVAADGSFHMCEKINRCFPIGNYEKGIIYGRVKKIFDKFSDNALKNCSECLISTQCSVCPATIANEDSFETGDYCLNRIELFKKYLVSFYSSLENNPNAFSIKSN